MFILFGLLYPYKSRISPILLKVCFDTVAMQDSFLEDSESVNPFLRKLNLLNEFYFSVKDLNPDV